MKRKTGSTIIIIILLLVGLSILLYPTISDQWNKRRAASLVTEYEQQIAEKDTSEVEDIRKLAISYNGTLIGNSLPDAFAELQLPPDATYDSMLNPVGTGYMGTVEIPEINVDLPIYHYTTHEVLEKGVGHLAGSSLPVGGENTHSVLSAHRGLPSAKLFTDLDRIELEDVFFIHVLEETLAYQVDLIKVIEPTDTSDLSILPGEDLCTLFTCTPYAVNTHRLLVRGHRIPYTEEVYEEAVHHASAPTGTSILTMVICVLIGLAVAALVILIITKRRKKKDQQKAAADSAQNAAENDVNHEKTEAAAENTGDDKNLPDKEFSSAGHDSGTAGGSEDIEQNNIEESLTEAEDVGKIKDDASDGGQTDE